MRKRVSQQPASLSFQPASSKERVLLENLGQLHSYDFSEVLEMYVDEHGREGSPRLPSGDGRTLRAFPVFGLRWVRA